MISVQRAVAIRIRSISNFIHFPLHGTVFTVTGWAAILGLDGYEPFTALDADAFHRRDFDTHMLHPVLPECNIA
jgi:hypothetical protein